MSTHPHSGWLQCSSGIKFPLFDPRAEHIDIHDIATGLSRTTRYNGQMPVDAVPDGITSVAQHSCYVHDLVSMFGGSADACLWGLLHDGHEAFYGDMVTPLKRAFPLFEELAGKCDKAIKERYAITLTSSEEFLVREMDGVAGFIESDVMFPNALEMWNIEHKPLEMWQVDPNHSYWTPARAREEFLDRFRMIVGWN